MSAAPLRVALIGMGRMGQAIDVLAPDREVEIVARIGHAGATPVPDAAALARADVAIDFTVPGAAIGNALACLRAGCPVVIGTTGWGDRLGELEAAVDEFGGRALWSPNFSMGVQLFLAIAADAAERIHRVGGFAVHIVETHHASKLDAPSGTAIALGAAMAAASQQDIGITSARVGSVPGTHEVIVDAPFEQIRLVHEARDRRVFADGAIAAARWLAAPRPSRVYTMRDVMHSAAGLSVG